MLRILSLVLLVALFAQPALSDDCQQGIRFYNEHSYRAASDCFERCLQNPISDPNIVYYAALTAQQLGQPDKAKILYGSIVQHFPKSEAGKLAAQAIKNISQSALQETANLPRETWVPFERVGNAIIVDAQINRKPLKMIFDTGADMSLLTESVAADLGISIPNRPPDASAGGVGKAAYQPVWMIPVTAKVGSIERHNFRVSVNKTPGSVALLGRDFYSGMEYTINDANKTIGFKRFGSASTGAAGSQPATVGPEGSLTVNGNGKYVYNIPFTSEASRVIVKAKVNGIPCDMLFDTGASICFFTPAQASQLAVNLPANAPTMPIQGVGGMSTARLGTINSVSLGKLELHDVLCAVGGKAVSPMPLLGQSFFKEFEFSIDSNNKVLHFTKR